MLPAKTSGIIGVSYTYRLGANDDENAAVPSTAANLIALEGEIAEIIYLLGVTADSGLVEVRVHSGAQAKLVRLAPIGFLKQGGLHLREGDVIELKGFPVAAMEGDLIVATEVHSGNATLNLRDAQGHPVW